MERDLANVLDGKQLFFDLLDRLGVGVLDLFRQPETFDNVKHDHAEHYDKEERDADPLIIADHRRDRAAEKIARARQQRYPKAAAQSAEPHKPEKRHLADAIKDAHRGAYAVNVFRDHDR